MIERPGLSLCPLAMRVRTGSPTLVGRPVEMAAIRQEFATASVSGLAAVLIEGEPGIGKTRLLVAAQEHAVAEGFLPIAVAADEELRGPFLLARSMLGCRQVQERVPGTVSEPAVRRALDALSGLDDPSLGTLAPAERLLRTYDQASLAISELASMQPLALILDDLQWADEDSLRLLRYVVRSDADSRILLLIAQRPEEAASFNELVTLVADMERLRLIRRLHLSRFSQSETAELLRHVLGGQIDAASSAMIHVQAEGVPFVVEELAKAYRDVGTVRSIDGTWTLAPKAGRLVPAAVQTLIGRRGARLPEETRAAMADAAVLGRNFSIRDVQAVRSRLDGSGADASEIGEAFAPAIAAGLLMRFPEGSAADLGFSHEQVRDFAMTSLSTARRRAIHLAVIDLLSGSGTPPPESLPILAHHARAAGNAELSAVYAQQAAQAALAHNAPEEVLRLVELGLPLILDAHERINLLLLRDEALGMLRRPEARLQALAEVSALADALGDSGLSSQVSLRRAAALRESGDMDAAAEVAREVRRRAVAATDPRLELAATLELGQALLRSPLGESYVPAMTEIDAVGAQEAFEAALALAEAVGDERSMAAASRELGVVAMAQVRVAFIEMYASGEIPKNVLLYEPLAVPYMAALGRFQRAIEVYDRLADRRGLMSAILGLAYATWGADFAFSGAIRRLEELRRLTARLATLTIESERTLAELQLLYGMHVYGREFGGPDLALSRGEEAYRKARVAGEPMIEQLAAGGVAMAYLQVGGLDEAALWLDRAAEAAAASPTPLKARRMEMWRGRHAAATGDAARMREHLGRAVEMARSQGLAAACCEALALLAIEAARLGADRADAELLQVAEAAAHEAAGLATSLPGRPPWHARAMAALTHVQSARGEAEAALQSARAVLAELDASEQEELFVDIRLPCLRAILAAGDADEASMVAARHRLLLGGAAEHTLDDDVRGRWFATMPQSELCALVGGMDAARDAFRESPLVVLHGSLPTASIDLNVEEQRLLELMTEARTDSEMAATLGISEDQLARQLAGVLARLNAPSRGAATAFALLQRLV